MHSFVAGGHTWEININVTQVRRVKGLVGVDLYTLVDDGAKPLAALLSDACKLVDVVYALVKDQADTAKVSDEDFGRLMGGDVLERAADAFVEELVDFFPSRQAANLRRLLAKGKAVGEVITQRATETMDSLDPQEIASRWLDSWTKSRGNSESIRGRSPSDPSP